jgi:ABC-2 type transport system permease protein
MSSALLAREWALLRGERGFGFACVLVLLLSGYAVWSGARWQSERWLDHQASVALATEAVAREAEQLAAIERGELPIAAAAGAGLPHVVRTELALPPRALAGVAIGEAELRPTRAAISATTRAHEMFRFQEVDNPILLGWGRFDLAFLVIFLLPLLVAGFSCTVLSTDRASGTLRLVLSQPVGAGGLASTRVLLRGGLLTLLVAAGATLGWAVLGTDASAPGIAELAMLAGVIVAYGAFWCALALWMVSRNRSSEHNALSMVLIWTLLVLVLPALTTLLAREWSPVPSRLEYITAAREAENEANARGRELLSGYLLDHPELEATRSDAVAPFIKTFVLVQREAEQAVAPIVARYAAAELAQRRLGDALRWVSPRDLAERALLQVAGNDPARFAQFEAQASRLRVDWLAAVQPPLIAGRRLTAAEYEGLPRPAFEEPPAATLGRDFLATLAVLGLFTLVAGIAAGRNFARFSPAADA